MTNVAEATQTDETAISTAAAHMLCTDWVRWYRTRKYLGAPKGIKTSVIGKLRAPMRATAWESPDGPMDADMQMFHTVINALPSGKAKQAFLMYYLNEVRPVKSIARALSVSRKHTYDLVDQFRAQVVRGYCRVTDKSSARLTTVELSEREQ